MSGAPDATAPDAGLEAALAAAGSAAASVRVAAPSADDRRAAVHHDEPLRIWLRQVGELVDQLHVAGVGFPDPDLPLTLAALSERAALLGLASAVEGLTVLGAWWAATGRAPDEATRRARAAETWDALQRFVAWLRVFRRGHALLAVERALEAEGEAGHGWAPTVSTDSAAVRPVALTLEAGGRATLEAVDVSGGSTVWLRDHLSDLDAEDPLGRVAVSRLFQDRVELGAVLDGVVRLDDHPVGQRGGARVFGPAFDRVPTVARVQGAVPAAEAPRGEAPGPTPTRIDLTVVDAEAGRLRTPSGAAVDLAPTAALRLNLGKRAVIGAPATLDAVVRASDDGTALLHAYDDLGQRVFPHLDPRCLDVPAAVVWRRADAASANLPAPLAAWVRSVAAAFGGVATDDVEDLRGGWRRLVSEGARRAGPAGVEAGPAGRSRVGSDDARRAAAADGADVHAGDDRGGLDEVEVLHRARLARRLLGLGVDAAFRTRAAEVAHAALEAAALQAGRPAPAALRRIAWALQLAWASGGVDPLVARRLWATRFQAEQGTDAPAEVAARALMMAALADEADADEQAMGEEALDAPTRHAAARVYLQAHLDALRPRPGVTLVLPPFLDLFLLAEVRAWLQPDEADDARPVAALNLERTRLAHAVALALGGAEAVEAADGLLVLAAAGLAGWVVASG